MALEGFQKYREDLLLSRGYEADVVEIVMLIAHQDEVRTSGILNPNRSGNRIMELSISQTYPRPYQLTLLPNAWPESLPFTHTLPFSSTKRVL